MGKELDRIKKLSGLLKESVTSDVDNLDEQIDMPHDAEITSEEAFAMVKSGRWDLKRFQQWCTHSNHTQYADSIDDDDDEIDSEQDAWGPPKSDNTVLTKATGKAHDDDLVPYYPNKK